MPGDVAVDDTESSPVFANDPAAQGSDTTKIASVGGGVDLEFQHAAGPGRLVGGVL
jgi:hypothetical protein